ncbi:MAG: ATP-binding protein [Bacteroidetes bacterium]|nr:MAG: ATP-binding protein [Bacteroidota bacterium]
MLESPFKYGTTVSGGAFTDREDSAQKLYDNLTQGINTLIISPRRWGKSSLVDKVCQEIEDQTSGIRVVQMDLFSAENELEFLELFAREVIRASSGKWEDWVRSTKEFFKQLIPKLTLGVDPTSDFSLSFDWDELRKHQDEILQLPERMAQKKNCRFVICIDEFQNLANFQDYEVLEKKMRAVWQRQKHVSYCLYGSKRHMMTEIFSQPGRPFYRFGDLMHLSKISREHWVTFIEQNFERTGKKIEKDCAELIPKLMKDHSWYVQQLAHYTWQKTKKKANKNELNAALKELIYANSPLYLKEIDSISKTQLNLLKAIVQGEQHLTSVHTMSEYRLGTPRNVAKNRDKLLEEDLIHQGEEGLELLDPAFELWFRKQFFGVSFELS